MSKAVSKRILQALEDIREHRYRSITYTHDGTVIIVDAETGISASGSNLAAAEAAFRKQVAA